MIAFARRLVLALLLIAAWLPAASSPAAERTKIRFNRDIRAILSDNCFQCHGPDSAHRKANLRLDQQESAKADRPRGKVLVAGQPDESQLIARITAADPSRRMPPADSGKELTAEEIALLRQWVEQGAVYEPHWSFLPPKRPLLPEVDGSRWARNAVDHFVLAGLEQHALKPSPEADRVTLLRRLHFDLLGLPPTAAEVQRFLQDNRPDAYERLVDRLLASPHYGERMALYWLDLVRYADTVGYHGDQEHHISPYRDYVIKAFNENMPFDQFTIEQLAGDLLDQPSADQLIATGYNRVLQTTHEGGAQDKEYLAKYAADRVRNVSGVWMGGTLGCAECHDHKFDPYTQKDFYSFAAFFADIQEHGAFKGPDVSPTPRPPEIEVFSPLDRQLVEQVEQQIERLEQQLDRAAGGDADEALGDSSQLEQQLAALKQEREQMEELKRLTMVTVSTTPRTMRVLNRGDWMDETGEIVEPAVPHFLEQPTTTEGRANRLDLARWLTSPDHPQTSRMLVNRLWYLLFGAGIFNTLEDSGSQGEWPTHPELLDWLAVELVESDWDVKHVIRLLVTSSTYRQSSLVTDHLREVDPANRLLARQSRYRLPAEMIRDNALAISGLLVSHMGGRSVRPYQPEGYYAHLNFPKRTYKHDEGANQYRRGVYTHWQRQFLHPMLKAFDAPSREECTAQRPISNTPLAALTLLNDPTFVEAASVFAARIMAEGGGENDQRLRWAWQTALSRQPQEEEVQALKQLYVQNLEHYQQNPGAAQQLLNTGLAARAQHAEPAELAAWTMVARTLLNLNETITRN